MDDAEFNGRAWVDLLLAELDAQSATHKVTRRAQLYMHGGLPLEKVLDALKISRATWYRRVQGLEEWTAANLAAAGPASDERVAARDADLTAP